MGHVIDSPIIKMLTQKFKLKDFLSYFISSEFIIGFLAGIGGWYFTWKIFFKTQDFNTYFTSIESVLSWLVFTISCLTSFIIMVTKTFNVRLQTIKKEMEELDHNITTSPKFNPEDSDILHKFNGLIAITNAKPKEWFTPFFYFYLINNGLITLKWRNEPICSSSGDNKCTSNPYFSFLDKKVNPLDAYQEERNKIIDSLKDGTLNILNLKKTLRFMFIQDEHFKDLQCNIACLYAIHDLFGAHLFVLKESLLDNKIVKKGLLALKESCRYESTGNLFDVAFGIKDLNKRKTISALYLNNVTGNIEEFPDANIELLKKLLKIFATKLKDEGYELIPRPENLTKYHFTVAKGVQFLS
jgi:hypothetical protein